MENNSKVNIKLSKNKKKVKKPVIVPFFDKMRRKTIKTVLDPEETKKYIAIMRGLRYRAPEDYGSDSSQGTDFNFKFPIQIKLKK